ncbi:ATP-binding protein [Sphingomonas sp. Leaf25]|uniref:ATP-binding protein n=1 Tax=Sphingomonas sp. Leaf25 TaxID=1735692 RepID=UPI000AA47E22|nr:ATP-binding protein [Sphingomonas sp. Leaf25]
MTIAPFLNGGGRAADMIRARDWSDHVLGPPETWPDALCSALSLVVNSPESMILCWGPDLTFFFNEAYFPLLGPRLDWAMGERFDRVWADGLEQAMPIIAAAYAGTSPRYVDVPWKLDTDRGAADTWWSFSYSRILDRDGAIAGLFIFTNETTSRVLSDAALKRSQAELTTALEDLRELNHTLEARVAERTAERNILASILETTDATVNVLDLDYTWLAINGAGVTEFERVFGVRPRVGDNLLALIADQPEQMALVRSVWDRALAGEEFTAIEVFGDTDRGHARRAYEMKFNRLYDDAGNRIGAFQFVTDVTDRLRAEADLREAQDALRQAQKMEAMGQLTGGVAHDFNNLLTPILGSLDLLQRRAGLSPRELRLIDGALQSAERARTLVQRLLAFARRQPLQRGAVDLSALIGGMADLIGSTIGPQTALTTMVSADLPPALADANQLEMAVLNLCVNARDAMPGGGRITIAADLPDAAEARDAGVSAGRYVRLSVIDTGTGMTADIAVRAIEPFFSTKGIGKGTGLGLSMVHGLALQLGGTMAIVSAPGVGTRIDLWLPVSAAAVVENGGGEDADPLQFRGRALVVDDEPLVRMTTAVMLQNLGYDTVEVDSATEAERVLNTRRFDLVVTDHLMPGPSGAWLARTVRDRMPGVAVLIVSGYAEVDGLPADLPRLTKPFREAELARAIAALGG